MECIILERFQKFTFVQNKKTYLILKSLEIADEATKNELLQYIDTPTTDETAKINAVTLLVKTLTFNSSTQFAQHSSLRFKTTNKVFMHSLKRFALRV